MLSLGLNLQSGDAKMDLWPEEPCIIHLWVAKNRIFNGLGFACVTEQTVVMWSLNRSLFIVVRE
jgi:hypothetical protein